MQKKILLTLLLPLLIIPLAFADNHNGEPESLCGLGTYYDAAKNACILDEDDIPEFEAIEFSDDFTDDFTDIEQMDDIPEWVRGIFYFWVEDLISDNELKEAIIFLINSGIIVL